MSRLIQEIPSEDRPREKLARLGPAALSDEELLALFIVSGMRGRSAIDIGRDLLARHGSLSALGAMPMSELCKAAGLGNAKAAKLAAIFELGARLGRERLRSLPLDSPERTYECRGEVPFVPRVPPRGSRTSNMP